MNTSELYSIILALLTAVASGLVGSFALMKRMTLAGDTFSHVALPGIGIALLFSINPILGGACALVIGALIVWKVENLSHLNTEAVIGVLFAVSLAVGAIAIGENEELLDTLFGGMTALTFFEFVLGCIIAVSIIWFIIQKRNALVLSLISKDLASTTGIATSRLQLQFLIFFALTIILGMKFLGVLLMGSLIIIPAAVARNVAHNLASMLTISAGAALIAVSGGLIGNNAFAWPLGPAVIIVAGILFLVTLLVHLAQEHV